MSVKDQLSSNIEDSIINKDNVIDTTAKINKSIEDGINKFFESVSDKAIARDKAQEELNKEKDYLSTKHEIFRDVITDSIRDSNLGIREQECFGIENDICTKDTKAFCMFNLIIEKTKAPEQKSGGNFVYYNSESLIACITKAKNAINEKIKHKGEGVTLSVTTPISIISDRDAVCVVSYDCCVYDTDTLEVTSRYEKKVEFLMANMIMPEFFHSLTSGRSKPTAVLMQDKGSWITYVTRYCLMQTLGLSQDVKDPEQMIIETTDKKDSTSNNKSNVAKKTQMGGYS